MNILHSCIYLSIFSSTNEWMNLGTLEIVPRSLFKWLFLDFVGYAHIFVWVELFRAIDASNSMINNILQGLFLSLGSY